jgi:hypothetical protein
MILGTRRKKVRSREEDHLCTLLKLRMNFGAGDRGRTGDVQLGNFLLKLALSIVAATTYLFFCAEEIFFPP